MSFSSLFFPFLIIVTLFVVFNLAVGFIDYNRIKKIRKKYY